jgi:hypothetical protein
VVQIAATARIVSSCLLLIIALFAFYVRIPQYTANSNSPAGRFLVHLALVAGALLAVLTAEGLVRLRVNLRIRWREARQDLDPPMLISA